MGKLLSQESYLKLRDIDWLKEQYIMNGRTLKSIAKEIGCSVSRLSGILKENGIHVGITRNPEVIKFLEDSDWLKNEHHVKRNSIEAIAENLGVGSHVVRRYFSKYEIEVLHDIIKGRPFTDEHKYKISIGKKKYKFTAEHIKHMSEANIGRHSTSKGPCPEEVKIKISNAQKGTRTGSENPFYGKHHTEETRKLLSDMAKLRDHNPMKGRTYTQEAKDKLREALSKPETIEKRKEYYSRPDVRKHRSDLMKERYRNGYVIHGRGKWIEFDSDRKFYLKSSYEIRVANKLESLGILWEYEPRIFDLGETTYRPDFYLPEYNIWWEVKGWLRSKDKMLKFFELYPEIHLKMVWESDIIKLETSLSDSNIYDIVMIGQEGLE